MGILYFSKNMQVELKKISAGVSGAHMYAVSVQKEGQQRKNVFILKGQILESWNRPIILRLELLQKSFIAQKLDKARYRSLKVSAKDLPIISWVDAIFTYQVNNKNVEIVLLYAAQGQTILNILKEYLSIPSDFKSVMKHNISQEKIEKCAYYHGLTLGKFQQLFMDYHGSDNPNEWTTVCHGDFHLNNILFDEKSSQIYYIDNETFSSGCSPTREFKIPLALEYLFNPQIGKIYLKSYLHGYFKSFKSLKRKKDLAVFVKQRYSDILSPIVEEIIKNAETQSSNQNKPGSGGGASAGNQAKDDLRKAQSKRKQDLIDHAKVVRALQVAQEVEQQAKTEAVKKETARKLEITKTREQLEHDLERELEVIKNL